MWIGAKNNSGYGLIQVGGILKSAHRVSYIEHNGEIPAGMVVMHSCDNRSCINPKHLSIGTHKENTRDMDLKKRCHRTAGENHHKAILTADLVREIRRRFTPYDKTNGSAALAREFCVSQSTVSAVIQGRSWSQA